MSGTENEKESTNMAEQEKRDDRAHAAKCEQVRRAIEGIAAENDNDFGVGQWVNQSLNSSEIQAYLSHVMHVEMPIVEIEQINVECNHAQVINDLKLRRK